MSAPEDAYEGLRAQALAVAEMDLTPRSPDNPDVVGAILDVPSRGGMVTIVAITDGASSMYTSVGGGVIGAGEHEPVAEANSAFLREVQALLPQLGEAPDTGHPSEDYVRVIVATQSGHKAGDLPADEFWGRAPTSVPGFVEAAHGLITQIRLVEQDRPGAS